MECAAKKRTGRSLVGLAKLNPVQVERSQDLSLTNTPASGGMDQSVTLTVVQIGFRECCGMDADTTITKSPHLVVKSHTPFKNIFQRSDRKQKFRMESIDVVRC